MAIVSLSNVLDARYIKRLTGLASGGSSQSKSALSSSSNATINQGLRYGARLYGTAVQGLNSLISFVNISKDTLGKLLSITDKMIDLTTRATRPAISDDTRGALTLGFKKLAQEFLKLEKATKVGSNNLLDKDGLKNIFQIIGLDEKTSTSVAALFAKFMTTSGDTFLASQYEKGKRPVYIPPDAFRARGAEAGTSTTVGDGTITNTLNATTVAAPGGQIIADFTGDGKNDLFVASSSGPLGSVLLGNGDGTFRAPVTNALGNNGHQGASGDFNQDGNIDVVTGLDGGSVSVLLGNGDGNFNLHNDYKADGSANSIANVTAVDMTGDGILDLVTVQASSHSVSVLTGNGNGTFKAGVSYAANGALFPGDLTVLDLNGDGAKDVVTNDASGAMYQVLLGNSNGTLKAAVTYAGAGVVGVTAADTNGDNIQDLIFAGADGWAAVAVALGNGNGTFKVPLYYAAGVIPNDVASGDFNGDGIIDLAAANSLGGASGISLLMGNGDGTFLAPVTHPGGSTISQVGVADITGDGVPDIIGVDNGGNGIRSYVTNAITTYTGQGTFQTRASYSTGAGTGPVGIVLNDFNLDGVSDAATIDRTTSSVSVLLGSSDGSFGSSQTFAVGGVSPDAIDAADFNRDGRVDLITTQPGANAVSLLLGNSDGTFAAYTSLSVDGGPTSVHSGDVNNDGKLDIITSNGTSNSISLRIGNGDGTFFASRSYDLAAAPNEAYLRDINGDGRADMVASMNASAINVRLGNGDGTFKAAISTGAGTGALHGMAFSDLNFDGREDLVTTDAGSNTMNVLLSNGNGTFSIGVTRALSGTPGDVRILDNNGDTLPDVAVSIVNSGGVDIFTGNGDGTFHAVATNSTYGTQTLGKRNLAVADLNNDGAIDLVTASNSDDAIGVLKGYSALNQGGFSNLLDEFASLFDATRTIRSRPLAYTMLADLKALKQQIGVNMKALDEATTFIADNMTLVRETGLALLELSNQITTTATADEVAAKLQLMIRQNANAAMAQSENLQAITVAALSLSSTSFTKSGN